MNAKFLAAAAFAVALVPAIANATSVYDPSVDSGASPFVTLPTHVNPANAAAAATDAQRYASVPGDAVIGTHGVSPKVVTEYDPGAPDGVSAFLTKLIIPGAADDQGAHRSSVAYADNPDLIGHRPGATNPAWSR
jgi:hypothetical protein